MKITHCETKLTRDSIKNLAKNSNTVGISQRGFETILLKISILSPEKMILYQWPMIHLMHTL